METPEMVKDKEMSKLDSIMMSEPEAEPIEPAATVVDDIESVEPVDA
jgi:hypothetical protein